MQNKKMVIFQDIGNFLLIKTQQLNNNYTTECVQEEGRNNENS